MVNFNWTERELNINWTRKQKNSNVVIHSVATSGQIWEILSDWNVDVLYMKWDQNLMLNTNIWFILEFGVIWNNYGVHGIWKRIKQRLQWVLGVVLCVRSGGGGGGGQAAKDAKGDPIKQAAWLKGHLADHRELTQGLKVQPYPLPQ